jgi:hypothetical protein
MRALEVDSSPPPRTTPPSLENLADVSPLPVLG